MLLQQDLRAQRLLDLPAPRRFTLLDLELVLDLGLQWLDCWLQCKEVMDMIPWK
jgi:hypothetical protein